MRTIDNTMGDRSSAGVSGPVTRGSIIARLERLPKNAMQVRARILIGLATFFDGFDVIAIAATLPILIAKWHLTPWEIGFLIGSGSIGQQPLSSRHARSAAGVAVLGPQEVIDRPGNHGPRRPGRIAVCASQLGDGLVVAPTPGP